MNRIVCITLATVAWAGTVSAQNNSARDSIVINSPKRVTIVTTDKQQRIDVRGSENDSTFHYTKTVTTGEEAVSVTREDSQLDFHIPFTKRNKSKRKKFDWEFGGGGFYLGFNSTPNAADGMDVKMGSSIEIEFNAIQLTYKASRNTTISLGLDMDWRNYRMKGTTRFLKENSDIKLRNYPQGADINFSRIKIFSINVPLLVQQNIAKNISIYGGPVVCFNTHGSLLTRYSAADPANLEVRNYKETSDNIHQTPVTFGVMAGISFDEFGIYAKYSPSNVLDTTFGPKFNSLTIGFCMGL